jgi:hypothetical protein
VGGRVRTREQGRRATALGIITCCSVARRGRWQHTQGRTRGSRACTHAGQQSVHIAERAQGAGRGCGQAQCASCTEAAMEKKCDNILSWGAWTRAGAAAQARGAAERARSGVRTGGREGKRPWCEDERGVRGPASEPRKCPKDQSSCLPASAARTAAPSAELRSASAARSRHNNLLGCPLLRHFYAGIALEAEAWKLRPNHFEIY